MEDRERGGGDGYAHQMKQHHAAHAKDQKDTAGDGKCGYKIGPGKNVPHQQPRVDQQGDQQQ